jgi:hypothetical protein
MPKPSGCCGTDPHQVSRALAGIQQPRSAFHNAGPLDEKTRRFEVGNRCGRRH